MRKLQLRACAVALVAACATLAVSASMEVPQSSDEEHAPRICPVTGAVLGAPGNPHGQGHPGAGSDAAGSAPSAGGMRDLHAFFAGRKAPRPRVWDARRFSFTGPPPEKPPADVDFLDALTRDGRIALHHRYVDDTLGGAGRGIRYSASQVDAAVSQARIILGNVRRTIDAHAAQTRAAATAASATPGGSSSAVPPLHRVVPQRLWLPAALLEHEESIRGARAVVFGSTSLAEESFLLALGAASVTLVDYLNVSIAHPRLGGMSVAQARAAHCGAAVSDSSAAASAPAAGAGADAASVSAAFERFDVAVSASAFDHDGLGRYGDALAADGDLLAMDELRCAYLRRHDGDGDAGGADADRGGDSSAAAAAVSADGAVSAPAGQAAGNGTTSVPPRRRQPLLFLSLPIGADAVVWNLHRRYGSLRLGAMLAGYSVLSRVGWDGGDGLARLAADPPIASRSYEPVWALAPLPPREADCELVRRALCSPPQPLAARSQGGA